MDLVQTLMQALMPQANAATPPPDVEMAPMPAPNRFGNPRFRPSPPPEPFGGVPIGNMPTTSRTPTAPFEMPPQPGITATLPGSSNTPAGRGGMFDAIQEAFQNGPAIAQTIPGNAVTPPSPPAVPPAPPVPPPVNPATRVAGNPPAGNAPFNITSADVEKFARNLFRGAAAADPRAPRGTALAQGGAGSMVGRYEEGRQERAEGRVDANTRFDQGLRTNADNRAERADSRAGKTSEIANTRAVQEIMRNASGTLNQADRLKVETLINQRARSLNPAGTMTPEILNQQLNAYRQELERGLGANNPAGANAPAATPPAGGYTREAPATPRTRQDVESLPAGTPFMWNGQLQTRK